MALLSLFDHLYCPEENLKFGEEEEEEEFEQSVPAPLLSTPCESERHHLLSATEAEPEEEDWPELLRSLLSKEGEFLPKLLPDGGDFSYLQSARKVAVEWVVWAARRHGFSALTALLAVNYLDRCFLPCAGRGELLRLQDDKPWMGRLAAVACLSLAAKVEETRVPLPVDLQMPETTPGGFVFEPKTIRRMELLVLSALGWRMNPVTPLSFLHHFFPRLHSKAKSAGTDAGAVRRIRALLRSCEATLLSAMADGRWVRHPTSVWAAAALLQATESAGEGGATAAEVQETRRLISLLKAPKEKVEECHQVIYEASQTAMIGHKRKFSSSDLHLCQSPPSPSGVIGSCFSRESSFDSWPAPPPPPPPRKRSNGNASRTPVDNRELRFH